MPTKLKYIAQNALDLFYQNYKSDIEFWTLDDAIDFTGQAAAAIYQNFYQQEYAMLRSEKKDDVVQFDIGWLSEQILDVKKNDGDLSAIIKCKIMTFPYDRQQVGVQNVFVTDPRSTDEVERTSISAAYQLKFVPNTNKIFFYQDIGAMVLINKGQCNVNKIRVLYVPSMHGESDIADGVIEPIITSTVNMMRQAADKKVIKKSLDRNQNEILQTEIDKTSLG